VGQRLGGRRDLSPAAPVTQGSSNAAAGVPARVLGTAWRASRASG